MWLLNSLASSPSTVRPFTNSGREISDKFTDNDVSNVPFIVVVIFFPFDIIGCDPGGKHLFWIIIQVLPVSSKDTRGWSNLVPPI